MKFTKETASEMGRLGGLVVSRDKAYVRERSRAGGLARAEALSPRRRRAIAKKASKAAAQVTKHRHWADRTTAATIEITPLPALVAAQEFLVKLRAAQ